jgi:hypothetical protein
MYPRLIKSSQNLDVAPFTPPGSSPIQIHGDLGATIGRGVAVEDLEEIEHNLKGLTMDIPDITNAILLVFQHLLDDFFIM